MGSGGTGRNNRGGVGQTPAGLKYLTERSDLVSLWPAGPGYGKVGDLAAGALGVPTLFARGAGPYIQACRDFRTGVDGVVAPPSLPRLPSRRGGEDVHQTPVGPGYPHLTRSPVPPSVRKSSRVCVRCCRSLTASQRRPRLCLLIEADHHAAMHHLSSRDEHSPAGASGAALPGMLARHRRSQPSQQLPFSPCGSQRSALGRLLVGSPAANAESLRAWRHT